MTTSTDIANPVGTNKGLVWKRHAGLRTIARKLQLGKILLKLRTRSLSQTELAEIEEAKRKLLPLILSAPSLSLEPAELPVHMLLHHGAVREAIWTLYSLQYFSRREFTIVIHSDGTLTDEDEKLLRSKFRKLSLIPRHQADRKVFQDLEARGLQASVRLRQNYVAALKLFDPYYYEKSETFIILDSDVLFFRDPSALLSMDERTALYSVGNGNAYSHSIEELNHLIGRNCVERCNTGVARLLTKDLDFERVERYLQDEKFHTNWYAEQTIQALELSRTGGKALPETYAIAPKVPSEAVTGHYCGAFNKYAFYTKAMPFLAKAMKLA